MTQFCQSGREPLSVRLPRVNAGALNIVPVTLDHLQRILSSLPNKSSCVEGDIPLNVLKLTFEVTGRSLLRIINKSIATETVPPTWKSAIVIPVYKRNDPSLASNFRPITLVPAICKVMEKIVHQQLVHYLRDQCLFSIDQHGFMSDHSTSTALLTVTDEILNGMDRSEVTLLTLIDLSRCFDVVDHSTLLTKLQQLQISTGWFRSYLDGHTQRVRSGESLSGPQNIAIGTFQGSCLGPLLFNIASNDLTCHIPSSINGFRVTVARYADDTQVAITGPRGRLTEMRASLESVLDTVCTWFLQHGMMVNAGKTELLLCGDRRQLSQISEPPIVKFMDDSLPCSNSVKNLGVIMDPALSWDLHIKHVTDRCTGILVALLNAKHLLPADVLPLIIDALVFSHVRYCAQVYASANRTTILRLQKVFKFAARVISGRRKFDHISDVLLQLDWLNVEQLLNFNDICLLHKILTTGEPEALRASLSYNHEHTSRRSRQSHHLHLHRVTNNHGKRTFMYRAVQLYNQHVVSNDLAGVSLRALKTSLRDILKCA